MAGRQGAIEFAEPGDPEAGVAFTEIATDIADRHRARITHAQLGSAGRSAETAGTIGDGDDEAASGRHDPGTVVTPPTRGRYLAGPLPARVGLDHGWYIRTMPENSTEETIEETIGRAARAVRDADALLIGAGAGMGVDSGLPDFRGDEGFWQAYPPFRHLGLAFEDLANPRWFTHDPERAWGFYGHRRNLYRTTVPHEGFSVLRRLAETMTRGCYVYTSNVDGQFQRAGFAADRVVECHGAIEFTQCAERCTSDIWPAKADDIDLDEATMRARESLPECPRCGAMARPNILMFGDFGWLYQRTDEQQRAYEQWLQTIADARLVIIECGAGTSIPSVRHECEHKSGQLIRINPREAQVPASGLAVPGISLPLGARTALERIEAAMSRL